jgi:hypothetical protein
MKKIAIFSILLSAAAVNLQALTLSGTAAGALTGGGYVGGSSSFIIVDTTGGDTLNSAAFTVGLTLSEGSSFGDYYVAAYNNVVSAFGATSVPGNAIIGLGTNGTAGGNTFYIATFENHTGDGITLASGNTFGLATGSDWQLDSNNSGTFAFGTNHVAIPSLNGTQFSVIPEPSSYAALSGLLMLGYVMVRRRG